MKRLLIFLNSSHHTHHINASCDGYVCHTTPFVEYIRQVCRHDSMDGLQLIALVKYTR